MKQIVRVVLLTAAIVLCGRLIACVWPVEMLAQQPDPQVQQLRADLVKAQITVDALADRAAKLDAQITQILQQSDAACVAAIEKKNPTKQVDPKTFVISDKPADGRGRGGR